MFLEFYGLNEQPFGVTPDPRFLYMGPAQQEAFSSLVYGIETGRGFMALIASPGLGKTTILLQLMERLRESARTAFLFQTHINPQDFLRSLLTDLGVKPEGQDIGDMQRQLGDLLIKETQSGKRIVVAIDEAQNLKAEILEMVRMLSNFETPRAKLLQIVLVGQPQLADILATPQLEQFRQRVSIITHFPPLDEFDVPKYIDHRLRVAGYRGGTLFTAAAMHLLAERSMGIPRNINNLCFQAMSLGFVKNQTKIDEETLREVIADLSLETLGSARFAAAEAANHAPHTAPAQKKLDARLNRPVNRAFLDSTPIAHEESVLDAVDLSSPGQPRNGNSRSLKTGQPAGRVPPAPSKKHSLRPVALLGLVAILVWLCSGGRLQSDLGYLAQVTGISGLSLSQHPWTTEGATSPPSAFPPALRAQARKAPAAETASNMQAGWPAAPPAMAGPATPSKPTARAMSAPEAAKLRDPRPASSRHSPAQETSALRNQGNEAGEGRLVVESSASGARITLNGKSNPLWEPRGFSS